MKKTLPQTVSHMPGSAERTAGASVTTTGAAPLHDSPRMVAQRQQLGAAFGTAQLVEKKKPMQHKAAPAEFPLQGKGLPKKKPGQQ
jgi:hypothetical protein